MRWVLLAIGLTVTLAVQPASAGECPGDVNDDNVVNVGDLLQVLGDWGACPGCASDINGDDVVDIQDLLALLGDWGCEEPEIEPTLSGIVTNAVTGDPLADVTVTVGDEELMTNEDGEYAGEIPPGIYDIVFAKANYITLEDQIVLFPDFPMTLDVALEPVAPVIVTIEVAGEPDPGGSVTATAIVEVFDGSSITGFEWMQTAGAEVEIIDGNMATATVNLGEMGDYKAELFAFLAEPPIGPDELPPGVPPPPEEFPGGIQDRFQVVGLNPWALEETALIGLAVDVTTTSGTYDAEDDVHTHLPWKPTLGLLNGPINVPVLLHGKDQDSYNWSLSTPGGSGAMLDDPASQNPSFTPDVPGLYRATVSDLNGGGTVTLDVWAGTWRGIIEGQDEDGHPISEEFCVSCHVSLDIDKFTPWSETGHARIFSDNLNTSTHYGPNCFPCHTVGFDPDGDNFGFDDHPDYQAFLDAGLLNNPGDNWTTMLEDFPGLARMANIQCENCHGPQNGQEGNLSPAHTQTDLRVNISADVCASCHGEPLRHGRFQQWQLSGHANYELAIDESQSGNCSRCHTGNGFLAWLPILTGEVEGDPYGSIEVTWTEDESHPQTCATCHDPHAIGTMSGDDNNATVRVSGDTPPLLAGFTAYGVGRGAVCMTCHNSRRGLRNDDVFDEIYQTGEAARAAHGSAQTDVLMGQNVYLMDYGIRGGHSFVTDTCTGCHMQTTPPPPQLSYNQSGTNHTFYANIEICADCHGEALEGEEIQEAAEQTLHALQDAVENAMVALMDDQIALGNSIDLNGEALITDVSVIADIEFGEYHGRQAITVTFTDETVLGPFRLSDVVVLDADMQELGELYDFADPALVKAGWNWALIHNDESLGVHNPTFAFTAMTNALTALDPLASVPVDWRTLLEQWRKSATRK